MTVRFAENLVAWQRDHGRNDLPWQGTRDPYRVWVSEIMLQQTQVATVIPYYERFMARFPEITRLANAGLDDVLAQWGGLGYYSRARNLHRAALTIRDHHSGRFPRSLEAVAALPGVGRSTAAAIMVFAYGMRHAILDGNVKRVLARVCGIAGYPGDKATADQLWAAAERLLAKEHVETYTQALMDLGAMICTRRQPRCDVCPVVQSCAAFREHRIGELPSPRPRKTLPHRSTVMLVLQFRGMLLLEKRPAPGIWGGLWCFPELLNGEDAVAACAQRFGAEVGAMERLPNIEHGFTHFRLTISPHHVQVGGVVARAGEQGYQWLQIENIRNAALPAPVKRIVDLVSRRTEAEACNPKIP